jgi:2-polyprenyl-6-methoxyphenol hydroxylase-like FAD-dependent oxidoreductase
MAIMRNQNVLISGAGVAGPSLAYWLARYGFDVTIVERAPAMRQGGQAVDFRGAAHLFVLEQMGVLDEIRQAAVPGGSVSFVDERGIPLATMAAEMASGDVEILRGDLGRVLYQATRGQVEYLFGSSILALRETAGAVEVTFAQGSQRTFDLVIGADGLHSTVRSLAFGPELRFIRHCGYYAGIASIDALFAKSVRGGGSLFSVPGRTAGVTGAGDSTRAVFYFASPLLTYDRHDSAEQKHILSERFEGMAWETPRLIEAMRAARDFYFDSISEIRMPALSAGRVALLGDAGYGGTLGGMGTGVAVVAAYILAGELAAAHGNHLVAFKRYESRIREYAEHCQRGARHVGSFMAPRTRLGVSMRNSALRLAYLLPGKGMMERIAMKRATGITFGDYPTGERHVAHHCT